MVIYDENLNVKQIRKAKEELEKEIAMVVNHALEEFEKKVRCEVDSIYLQPSYWEGGKCNPIYICNVDIKI